MVANLALWVYSKSRKQYSLKKSFRYAHRNLETLLYQLQDAENNLQLYGIPNKRNKYLAQQFLFHGFIPISKYKTIKEEDGTAYITSTLSINGITYIYPKKLYMSSRPGKHPDKRFLWYQFSGIGISGYTRAWYTMEIKSLKRIQDAQYISG